jgi:hypothetical protein
MIYYIDLQYNICTQLSNFAETHDFEAVSSACFRTYPDATQSGTTNWIGTSTVSWDQWLVLVPTWWSFTYPDFFDAIQLTKIKKWPVWAHMALCLKMGYPQFWKFIIDSLFTWSFGVKLHCQTHPNMVSCFHRFCPFLDVEVDILLENWVSYGLDEAIPATQQLYEATAVGPRFGCIGFEWLLRQEIGKLEKQYMMTNLVDLRSPRHTLKCAAIVKKVVSMYYQPNHKHHINHIHHAINLTYPALPPYQPNYLRWFQLPIPKIFVNWWSLSLTIPNDVEIHIIINNHCPISSSMGLSEHMCPEIPCFMTLWILKSA